MRIGLLGFGTVGKGVYEITAPREDMTVVRVLCRRDLTLKDAQVTHNFDDILLDPTIDTVVEAVGGLHPAYEYVRSAIEAGKNVATANKALIATYYDELIPLAEKKGVFLRCTASVGGGIGWLSELERASRIERIHHVGGIMNGTCNYILDSMTRLGLGYSEALRQAQSLGYAEADPTTDVEGIDTWHKLIVSANIGFGVSLDTYPRRRYLPDWRGGCGEFQRQRPGVQAGFHGGLPQRQLQRFCAAHPVPSGSAGGGSACQLQSHHSGGRCVRPPELFRAGGRPVSHCV